MKGEEGCDGGWGLTLVPAAEDLLVHLARTHPSLREGEARLSYVIDLAFQRVPLPMVPRT